MTWENFSDPKSLSKMDLDSQDKEVQSEIWIDQQFMHNIDIGIFEDSQEVPDGWPDNNNSITLKSDINISKNLI